MVRYEGLFKNNQVCDSGKYHFKNGIVYDGKFDCENKTGDGLIYFDGKKVGGDKFGNLIKYVGNWKNYELCGSGTIYFESGELYCGSFKNSRFNGKGSYFFDISDPNFIKYEGKFKGNKPYGKGKMYVKNSEIIAGRWSQDLNIFDLEDKFKHYQDDNLKDYSFYFQNFFIDKGIQIPQKVLSDIFPNYIFTSDKQGHLKQFAIQNQAVCKDYGQVHSGRIRALGLTSNNEYLFTADDKGHLKQFNIIEHNLVKDHGKVYEGFIRCLCITPNNEYLFIAGYNGY